MVSNLQPYYTEQANLNEASYATDYQFAEKSYCIDGNQNNCLLPSQQTFLDKENTVQPVFETKSVKALPKVQKQKKIQKTLPKVTGKRPKNLQIATMDPEFMLECDEATFEHMPSPTEVYHKGSFFFVLKNKSDMEETTALVNSVIKPTKLESPLQDCQKDSPTIRDYDKDQAPGNINHQIFTPAYIAKLIEVFPQNRFSTDQIQKELFIATQNQINEKMRAVLINWLLSIHAKLKLKPQTFFIAVQLLDKYCLKKEVERKNFQKIGIACLYIAAKFEEIFPPKLSDIIKHCEGLFTRGDLISTEAEILTSGDFSVSSHTVLAYAEILSYQLKVPSLIMGTCTALLISSLFDLRTTEFDFDNLVRSCLFLAVKIMQQHNSSSNILEHFNNGLVNPEKDSGLGFQELLLSAIMAENFDFRCVKFVTYLVKNLEKAGMFAIRKLFPCASSQN